MKQFAVAAAAALTLAGCAGLFTADLGSKTLQLTPRILNSDSYQTQSDVHLWKSADVSTVSLSLILGTDINAVPLKTKNIASGSFALPVTFSNLKDQRTYTVLAKAYDTYNNPISDNASSSITITVGTDTDATMAGTIPVALNNVQFAASGSANLQLKDGVYTYTGDESISN